jgi:hypothetical protein
MVHALRRARQHLRPGGLAVLIQPHQYKRPHIAIVSARKRQPVATLINPVFQPLINSANAAIESFVEEKLFERLATSHHRFSVRLANPAEMQAYLHQGLRPPRFPPGGRQRLRAAWNARPADARIETTEFLTVLSLRAISGPR